MAGIRMDVTASELIIIVRLSRSVSTLAVPQKAPKTGSLLPPDRTEIADRNIKVFPLNDSGSGSYTFICVPLSVLITLGQSLSSARLKPKDNTETKSSKNFTLNFFIRKCFVGLRLKF